MNPKATLHSCSQLRSVSSEFDPCQGPDLLCDALNVESGHNIISLCSSSLLIVLGKVPSPFHGLGFPLPEIMVVIIILFFYEVKT